MPDKRINTLVQMPILAKRKEFTDGDDKKARDSVTISNRFSTHLVLLHPRESVERLHEVFSCARHKSRNQAGIIPRTRIRFALHASGLAHPDSRRTTWNNKRFFFPSSGRFHVTKPRPILLSGIALDRSGRSAGSQMDS